MKKENHYHFLRNDFFVMNEVSMIYFLFMLEKIKIFYFYFNDISYS